MTVFIYAIVVCVNAGSTSYCHPLGEPFFFRSADQCIQAMSTRVGHGNLVDGRFYGGNAKVWYECDQRPTSQWAPVQSAPAQRYVVFICKTDQACQQIGQPIDLLEPSCIDDMIAALDKSKYEVVSNRIYAKGERSAWYECAKAPSS